MQGVGFRAFVLQHAETRAGLRGWVRNRRNGDVEAVFAGSADDVAALCDLCRKGPSYARVERFEVFEADEKTMAGLGDGFHQLATV